MKFFLLFFSFIFCFPVFSVEPSKAFVTLAKKVRNSVVNISTTQKGYNKVVELFPGYFMPFNQPETKGAGSGFIVSKEGLIITNSHVVKGFDKIQIQFVDEEVFYPAKLLGSDDHSDIALLKVETKKKLKPIALGDSSQLEVGEWVAAIGNPHGYGHTMTQGIISAVQREIDALNLYPLLQTDASINPGNSGGPLMNLKGEVVGVNQAIARGASGISFAIPINNVKEVMEDLKKYGYVRKAYIGVHYNSYDPEGKEGVLIGNVITQSPAQKAGIKKGDRIIEFNGRKIKKPNDLPKLVRKTKVGQKVRLQVIREGKSLNLTVIPELYEGIRKTAVAKTRQGGASKAKTLPGAFQVIDPSDSDLSRFGHPGWIRNPLVINVKRNSSAFKAGLRNGDMFYEINSARVLKASDVEKTLKKGRRYQLSLLRFEKRSNRYRIVSLQLNL